MQQMNRKDRRRGQAATRKQEKNTLKYALALQKQIKKHFPFYFRHDKCQGVAFYYTEMPDYNGGTLDATKAMYPNGDAPQANATAKCGTCGAEMMPDDLTLEKLRANL